MRRNRSSVLFLTLYPVIALLIIACVIVAYFLKRNRKAANDEDHHQQGTLGNEERKSSDDQQTEEPSDILLLNSTSIGPTVSREVEIQDKQLFKAKADAIMADFEAQMDEILVKSPCYRRTGWRWQAGEKRSGEDAHEEQTSRQFVRKQKFHPTPLPDEAVHNIL